MPIEPGCVKPPPGITAASSDRDVTTTEAASSAVSEYAPNPAPSSLLISLTTQQSVKASASSKRKEIEQDGPPSKRKKIAPNGPPAQHRMTTRARGKIFKFMDLPPELRNRVYRFASTNSPHEPVHLDARFRLSPLLSVSKVIRSEALPIFFDEAYFTISLRSNWCALNGHFHGDGDILYESTGTVELHNSIDFRSVINMESVQRRRFPQAAIRIRRLQFFVRCICCRAGRLGVVNLEADGTSATTTLDPTVSGSALTQVAMTKMTEKVKKAVNVAVQRDHFIGFTVLDVVKFSKCFRMKQKAFQESLE